MPTNVYSCTGRDTLVVQKPGTWAKYVYGVCGSARMMHMMNAHVVSAQAGGTATRSVELGRLTTCQSSRPLGPNRRVGFIARVRSLPGRVVPVGSQALDIYAQ